MRRYETVHRQFERVIEVTCDLCGRTANNLDWGGGSFEVNETEVSVTVRQKEGSSYPEGGMGTEHNIDLCPQCFKDRLIPWLRSQGAQISQTDWDW